MNRITEVPEAEEVTVQLDDSYWTSTPLKRHHIQEERRRPDFDNLAKSIARKLKYEYLLWKVYESGDVGTVPCRFFEDIMSICGGHMSFKVVSTKPTGEVQITPKTKFMLEFVPQEPD